MSYFGIPIRNGLAIGLGSVAGMSSSSVATVGAPSLLLNFLDPTLDPRITFTRASGATRTNAAGLIESVAVDAPRFDYDPVTLAPMGLLIEESRTNLITYSSEFDNAVWNKTNSIVIPNSIVSPDGAMNADKVQETNVTSFFGVNRNPAGTFSTTYTWSCYAKAAERAFLFVNFAGSVQLGTFNLLTGQTTVTGGTPLLTATPVGDGWWRCTITFTTPASGVNILYHVFGPTLTSAGGSYVGAEGSGIYIWGAQLEAGAFATSYIPTEASQVTRAADLATMTGTNFSSWYNQTEGTIFANWTLGVDVTGVSVYSVDDGTNTNLIRLRYGANGLVNDCAVIVTNVAQTILQATSQQVVYTTYKNAMAYKLDNFARSADGATVNADSAGTVPTVTTFNIGKAAALVEQLNGHIKQISYYPRRLSDAQLQAISAS